MKLSSETYKLLWLAFADEIFPIRIELTRVIIQLIT